MSNNTREAVTLNAKVRENAGKGVARSLRREGQVPAIMYGGNTTPVMLSLPANEVKTHYLRGHLQSRLLGLTIDGGKTAKVLPQAVSLHPVTDEVEHIDFLSVSDDTIVKVDVPVKILNRERCVGIKRGGALNIVRHAIEMFCKATAIPSSITADILKLNIGESLHIEDVEVPESCTPVAKHNFTIATITGRVAKTADDAEEGEGEGEGDKAESE